MLVVNGEVEIAKSADEVFDFVADARNEPKWLPGASTIEMLTPEPVGVGTRFRGRYARTGPVTLELVVFDRPCRVTFRAVSAFVDFDDEVVFHETTAGTRLSARMTAEPKGHDALPVVLHAAHDAESVRLELATAQACLEAPRS